MPNFINSYILQNLRQNVLKTLSKPSYKQVWINGPEGRGKTTFVNHLFNELMNLKNHRYVTSYVDFYNLKNFNYQTSFFKYLDFIISSCSSLSHINENTLKQIFEDLKQRFPKFGEHTHYFYNQLAQTYTNKLSNNKKWRDSLLSINKESFKFDHFWNMSLLTYELHTESFGLSNKSNYNKLQLFLVFLNSIAHRVDINEHNHLSNNSNLFTGKWSLSYLFEAVKSISNHENINWILCNDGIEHLIESPFLNDRGTLFLSNLIFNIRLSDLPCIFISNDSTTPLTLFDEHYRHIFSKNRGSLVESNNSSFGQNKLRFYDLPELASDQSMSYLSSHLPFHEKYIKSLSNITGGNWSLMNKILSDYKNFEKNLSLGTVQQILSGSPSLVDDEYFPIHKSKDEQLHYLKEEQLKMFIKNLYHDCFNKDVIVFENSMNELLSSSSIQKMGENVKNDVHFKVIVYETIRYLLNKKWMRVNNSVKIDNKIILALISANILFYQLGSEMLEFKNSLVKYLLRSYIDIEYESLKPVEKIEYKANLLVNQKGLYKDLDKFFV